MLSWGKLYSRDRFVSIHPASWPASISPADDVIQPCGSAAIIGTTIRIPAKMDRMASHCVIAFCVG